jgi:nucleotide-binding universal stress UspA family protein
MFRTFLVPLDGSPFGEHALPLAVSLARRCQGVIELVRVPTPESEANQRPADLEPIYLEAMAARIAEHAPEVDVHTCLLHEERGRSVADQLADHAVRTRTDLIVLNSHTRGGLARWWFGSITDDLVHRTTCPLLVMPSRERDPDWDTEKVFRHILIPLDGTPVAEQVLPAALTLGVCMEAEVTLLRVVEPMPVSVAVTAPIWAAIPPDPDVSEFQEAAATAYLTRVVARLRGNDGRMRVRTGVVLDPDPSEGICGFLRHNANNAEEVTPIDVIALATHGREGLARLLLGSVTDRVLQHTPVPLLLQRAKPTS